MPGEVLLPREPSWLTEFRRELQGFPRATKDDQPDSVSQLLNWSRGKGLRRALSRGERRERINVRR